MSILIPQQDPLGTLYAFTRGYSLGIPKVPEWQTLLGAVTPTDDNVL
jgi:hypothetical protein